VQSLQTDVKNEPTATDAKGEEKLIFQG